MPYTHKMLYNQICTKRLLKLAGTIQIRAFFQQIHMLVAKLVGWTDLFFAKIVIIFLIEWIEMAHKWLRLISSVAYVNNFAGIEIILNAQTVVHWYCLCKKNFIGWNNKNWTIIVKKQFQIQTAVDLHCLCLEKFLAWKNTNWNTFLQIKTILIAQTTLQKSAA